MARIESMSAFESWPVVSHVSSFSSRLPLVAPNRSSAAVNLLCNGTFERPCDEGWQFGCQEGSRGTAVVSGEAAYSGLNGLKLFAPQGSDNAAPVVWAVTPPLTLPLGQRVRISGRINVRSVDDSGSVIITDSFGQAPLSLKLPTTNGWQEFSLFRAVTENEPLHVTFAITGAGTVSLDDVTIVPLSR